MSRTVFVSYSRKDKVRVEHAVKLLEAGGAEVFRDLDDIQFGDRWAQVITDKLHECERVLVFWSQNASHSEWVEKEYNIALAMHKRLVPVLLDDTPLPPQLSQFHALTDFMPKHKGGWVRYGGWLLGGVSLVSLIGVVVFPMLSTLPHRSSERAPGPGASQAPETVRPPEVLIVEPPPPKAIRAPASAPPEYQVPQKQPESANQTLGDTKEEDEDGVIVIQPVPDSQPVPPAPEAQPMPPVATEEQAPPVHIGWWLSIAGLLLLLLGSLGWQWRQARQQQQSAAETLVEKVFEV